VPSFPRAGQKPWQGEARPNEPLQPMATGLEQAARPIHAGHEADNIPPAAQFIHSPDDGEAHDARKHTTQWVGDKVQLTETCDDDLPHLIQCAHPSPPLALQRDQGWLRHPDQRGHAPLSHLDHRHSHKNH
jgi:hypothetical protein